MKWDITYHVVADVPEDKIKEYCFRVQSLIRDDFDTDSVIHVINGTIVEE